jgi:hypothetical protein
MAVQNAVALVIFHLHLGYVQPLVLAAMFGPLRALVSVAPFESPVPRHCAAAVWRCSTNSHRCRLLAGCVAEHGDLSAAVVMAGICTQEKPHVKVHVFGASPTGKLSRPYEDALGQSKGGGAFAEYLRDTMITLGTLD